MKKAPSPSRPCWLFRPHFFLRAWRGCFFGKACSRGSKSTASFSGPGNVSCTEGQEGYLLLFLVPVLLLLTLFLAGSLKVAWKTQAKVALQARLDVCALRMALERKATLALLVRENQAITLTVLGIYAARGAKAAGPVGAVLGGVSEAVLLRTNKSLALLQDSQLRIAGLKELGRFGCETGRYSREPAGCLPSPTLFKATSRNSTLFPDVKGTLRHERNGQALASFHCRGGLASAAVELRGNGDLLTDGFTDVWTE